MRHFPKTKGPWIDASRTQIEDVGWHRLDKFDSLSLTPGQEAKLRLSVRRTKKDDDPYYNGPVQDYAGPIHIKAEQLSAGVAVKPCVMAQRQTKRECGTAFRQFHAKPVLLLMTVTSPPRGAARSVKSTSPMRQARSMDVSSLLNRLCGEAYTG